MVQTGTQHPFIPHPELEAFPIVVEVAVRWGDMDAFSHVNNTSFFRYFEVARVAFFDAVGFREGARVGPILSATSCRFRRPVTYPDSLQVGVRVSHVEQDRFTHEYVLISSRLDDLAAKGDGVVVAYDYREGGKTMLPADVRKRIEDLRPGDHLIR